MNDNDRRFIGVVCGMSFFYILLSMVLIFFTNSRVRDIQAKVNILVERQVADSAKACPSPSQ